MAIINNQTTANGDVLYIETSVPAIGITTLVGFSDDVESVGTSYDKKFQYSKDGIIWSEWIPLTISNIQSVNIGFNDKLFLKYRYQQVGDGVSSFNSNVVTGIYENTECPFYFKESIFNKYFSCNDIRVLKWYINVTEKLYQGELNKYLKFDVDNTEDAILFWQSIAKFFAFYVILSRVFRDFYLNESLISRYLQQRGLFTSRYNILSEYNALMKNFSNEISKRGTKNILNKKSDGNLFDGELRRFLNIQEEDELIFNYYLPHHCGWWVDSSSPQYRGLEGHLNANKLPYEKYCLTNNIETIINQSDKNDISLICVGGNEGIVYNGDLDKLINIDLYNNYVLEFDIEATEEDSLLDIGIDCFSTMGISINNGTKNFKEGTNSKFFVENLNLNRFHSIGGKFPIKCIIYNKEKPYPFEQGVLNIDVGNNLIFDNNIDIKKIYPFIKVTGGAIISNVSFRQLYTHFERGFVNMNHFVTLTIDNSIIF